ncbi:MAG: hypothetical protein IM559_10595 [Pseudanabaena sp. M151S2SP2A07QC]|nr:hypothetical protein [Pseudanabaena sp. M151S2SP2A07QC]
MSKDKYQPSLYDRFSGFLINNVGDIPRQAWAENQTKLIKSKQKPSVGSDVINFATDAIEFKDQEVERDRVKREYLALIAEKQRLNKVAKQRGESLPYSEEQIYQPTSAWGDLLKSGKLPDAFEQSIVNKPSF